MTFALPGILLAAALAQQTSDAATTADRKACAALADLATSPARRFRFESKRAA
jgi:hypothetical protein